MVCAANQDVEVRLHTAMQDLQIAVALVHAVELAAGELSVDETSHALIGVRYFLSDRLQEATRGDRS
jgi:hypothetical protein